MKACQSLCELSRNNNDIPLNKLVVGGTHLDSKQSASERKLFRFRHHSGKVKRSIAKMTGSVQHASPYPRPEAHVKFADRSGIRAVTRPCHPQG